MSAPTREQAIQSAAVVLAEAELELRTGTVEEAALRALEPGGPPFDELVTRIAAVREADRARAPRTAAARPRGDSRRRDTSTTQRGHQSA